MPALLEMKKTKNNKKEKNSPLVYRFASAECLHPPHLTLAIALPAFSCHFTEQGLAENVQL